MKLWNHGLGRVVSAAAVAAFALFGSCARFDPAWVPFSDAAQAQDQIMLVRQTPPSFGFLRLVSHAQIHPDLALFVQQRGIPDFLAETGDSYQHYLILYYIKARHAFACRSRRSRPGVLEFAGPYPITPGEYRLLDAFRRGKFH